MKRVALNAGLLWMILSVCALPALAKGTADVSNTIHNLSTSSPYFYYVADDVTEVCVFCHTPHGGSTEGPLWNRNLPAANAFTHYSSTTLSADMQLLDPGRDVSDESRLCLSCHDGSLTLDHLLNPPNELNGGPLYINSDSDVGIVYVPGVGGGNIGDGSPGYDLTNDHPISFSYSDIQGQPIYQTNGARDGELWDVATAESNGVRFFNGGSNGNNRVECSSCHDPHVDYPSQPEYSPFLITPNSGSSLCLACHNK